MAILNLTLFVILFAIFFRYISKTYKEQLNSKICKNYKDGPFIEDCDISFLTCALMMRNLLKKVDFSRLTSFLKRVQNNKHFKYGAPMVILVVGAPFVLTYSGLTSVSLFM